MPVSCCFSPSSDPLRPAGRQKPAGPAPGGPLCPHAGAGKIAYAVYQLATLGILLALCAGRIQTGSTGTWYGGLTVYLLGLVLCAVSVLHFAPQTRMA